MIKNQAGQVVNAQLLLASTGAPFAGAVTVNVTIDTGAQTAGGGTVTAKGTGQFQYAPTIGETNGDTIAYQFVGVGAVDVVIEVDTITPAQQSALATASSALAVPILTILTDAFAALNIYGANELPSPEDAELARGLLNTIFDDWNADRPAVYCQQFSTFAFTPSLSPHTIGPTGTWVVSQRPVSIDKASWISNGVFTDIPVSSDPEWYNTLPVPGQTSAFPLGGYYEPNWPNGNLWLYPVPTVAYAVELMTRVVLGAVLLTDTFSMPPGYRSAVTLTLEEALISAFPGAQTTGDLTRLAAKARGRVFSNNVIAPKLATQDSGMPGGGRRSYFDFRTGTIR